LDTKKKPVRPERPSGRPAPKVRPGRGVPPRIEILSVGSDLLRGLVADANAQAIARQLTRRGCSVRRVTVVDDEVDAIAEALREALGRSPHLLVTSGGLGPAPDDRTRLAVAEVLGRPLAINPRAKAMVEQAYQKMARSHLIPSGGLNEAREKLCRLPVGSLPVDNPGGLAPGVICRLPGGTAVVCLPGKPEEMKAVLEAALPELKDIVPKGEVAQLEIESPTPDESTLKPLLERVTEEFPGVWISSHPSRPRGRAARILITLEAAGTTKDEAKAAVGAAQHRMLALVSGAL